MNNFYIELFIIFLVKKIFNVHLGRVLVAPWLRVNGIICKKCSSPLNSSCIVRASCFVIEGMVKTGIAGNVLETNGKQD